MITPPLSMSAMPRLTRAVPVWVGLEGLDAVLRDTVNLIRIGGFVLRPWEGLGRLVKWGISEPPVSPVGATSESSISKKTGIGAPPASPSARASQRRRAAWVGATASL